jgi:hypothetical protein
MIRSKAEPTQLTVGIEAKLVALHLKQEQSRQRVELGRQQHVARHNTEFRTAHNRHSRRSLAQIITASVLGTDGNFFNFIRDDDDSEASISSRVSLYRYLSTGDGLQKCQRDLERREDGWGWG